jgi:hypothetical protein
VGQVSDSSWFANRTSVAEYLEKYHSILLWLGSCKSRYIVSATLREKFSPVVKENQKNLDKVLEL